ncbi:MAG: cupin domain-containing protein [Candidatus Bathyarchaeia archaeon]
MKIISFKEVEAKDVGEGSYKARIRWLITKDIGAENFAMRLFEIEPGGYTPLHKHPWEHEVFILEGRGKVIGEAGESEFKSGDAIFIPANETHQFVNNGERTLLLLCLIPYQKM